MESVWKEIVASFYRTEFESNDVIQSSSTLEGSGRKLLYFCLFLHDRIRK